MRLPIILVLLLCAVTAVSAQRSVAGRVVEIIDGKTIVLSTSSGPSTIELQYIEVPKDGAIAGTVKDHLRLLTLGKDAVYTAHIIRTDRSAGILEIGGVDMAGQMLRDGAAWHVPSGLSGQQNAESESYATLESAAKGDNRGIWSIPGLKAPWDLPALPPVPAGIRASEASARRTVAARNPRLGDTGYLLNGYDPASRTGFLSTSLMGVDMHESADDMQLAVDITYYYKEDEKLHRAGSFVFTLISESQKPMFEKDGAITLYGGGKPVTIPVAQRTVKTYAGRTIEKVLYRIDRSVLDRLVNNDAAYLKIKNHVLLANTARYLFYTLLQVTG